MLPSLALGSERPEKNLMDRPPVGRYEKILDWEVFKRGYFFIGIIEATAAMAAFISFLLLHGWHYGEGIPGRYRPPSPSHDHYAARRNQLSAIERLDHVQMGYPGMERGDREQPVAACSHGSRGDLDLDAFAYHTCPEGVQYCLGAPE
jgi:hypothetical protein